MAAHDLHHRAALMGLHGIPELVDTLHRCVAGGVKPDGIIGAADVIVYGCRDSHHRNAQPGELQGAPEGPVSADGHDSVQPQQPAGRYCS